MISIGAKLQSLRKERGLTQGDLAKVLGCTRTAISNYEIGTREPDFASLEKLARYFGVSIGYFFDDIMPLNSGMPLRRIPILGDTAAGAPITAERVYDEYVELPADGKRYDAAVHITGDSMEPTYRLGDLALLRYQPDVEDGEAAVVCIDDTVTLKRVYHLSGKVMLQSDNPKYKPIIVSEGQCNNIHLVGKVVGFVHWEE